MNVRKAALITLLAFACLLAGVLFSSRLKRVIGIGNPDAPAVIAQIKQLNQLVTVRYSVQRIVGLKEEKQPLGEESILLMVQGEVLAGVDLAALSPSGIQFTGPKSLAISLPQARIFNSFLDEKQTKVWDRRITWWTPWVPYSPDLEHKARLQAIDDVRNAALSMGILQQAQKNADLAIRDLLAALGLNATLKQAGV